LPDQEVAGEDLDALVRRVDIDRWLSTRFVADADTRADLIAVYAFDHELARAIVVTSNPLLAEIRLTWWREALDEIYGGQPVRRHPTAQALARAVGRRKLPPAPLEAMIDGRLAELDVAEGEMLSKDAAIAAADLSGGGLVRAAALVLDPAAPEEATFASGRKLGLSHLIVAGKASMIEVGPAVTAAGVAEGEMTARLSAQAFLAVLPMAAGHIANPLFKRLRLMWAVARGKL
jgi:phytoene synthase